MKMLSIYQYISKLLKQYFELRIKFILFKRFSIIIYHKFLNIFQKDLRPNKVCQKTLIGDATTSLIHKKNQKFENNMLYINCL